MSTAISDLIDFLGISLETPENFSEFMPWFLTILVGLAFVFAIFGLIRAMVIALCDRRFF